MYFCILLHRKFCLLCNHLFYSFFGYLLCNYIFYYLRCKKSIFFSVSGFILWSGNPIGISNLLNTTSIVRQERGRSSQPGGSNGGGGANGDGSAHPACYDKQSEHNRANQSEDSQSS